MKLIEARGLTKEFRIFSRSEGVMGAFRDLFHRKYRVLRAVDEIDFAVDRGRWWDISGPMAPENQLP